MWDASLFSTIVKPLESPFIVNFEFMSTLPRVNARALLARIYWLIVHSLWQHCPSNIGAIVIIFTEIWLPLSSSQLSHRLLFLKQLTEIFQDYLKGILQVTLIMYHTQILYFTCISCWLPKRKDCLFWLLWYRQRLLAKPFVFLLMFYIEC